MTLQDADAAADAQTGRHAYGRDGIWGEGLRAGAGLILGLGLMLVAPSGGAVFFVGVLLAVLFAAYAAGVLVRRRTVIRTDPAGIEAETGLPAAVPLGLGSRRLEWREVTAVSLRYFSTRRDRSNGWMQLTVTGRGGSIVAQSTISGFPALARRAGRAALRDGLPLGTATRRNLQALGLRLPDAMP